MLQWNYLLSFINHLKVWTKVHTVHVIVSCILTSYCVHHNNIGKRPIPLSSKHSSTQLRPNTKSIRSPCLMTNSCRGFGGTGGGVAAAGCCCSCWGDDDSVFTSFFSSLFTWGKKIHSWKLWMSEVDKITFYLHNYVLK